MRVLSGGQSVGTGQGQSRWTGAPQPDMGSSGRAVGGRMDWPSIEMKEPRTTAAQAIAMVMMAPRVRKAAARMRRRMKRFIGAFLGRGAVYRREDVFGGSLGRGP